MKAKTLSEFQRIVYDRIGITLNDGKSSLIENRIGKRLRELNLPNPEAYLELLKDERNDEEFIRFTDAISTNVTSFFRESVHFDVMSDILGEWLAQGQRKFRFWSAASSSGEEPYTMAITALEAFKGFAGVNARILATDISTRMLRVCMEGIYRADKVERIPKVLRNVYFDRFTNGDSESLYRASDALRSLIAFRRLNLSETPFPMSGPMDAIFIRNVMIYFDVPVKQRLLDEAYRLLKPGGYLFVGHSEGLTGFGHKFKQVKSSVYMK
jgi:chemotaxis protein methyltransferase CheR